MAKVYVKLARSSSQELEQHSAYNKAIEILRKEESVEVVEVLIEYAEWMQRRHYASTDIEDQLLLAVDILMDIEPGWDEDEDDKDDYDYYDDDDYYPDFSEYAQHSQCCYHPLQVATQNYRVSVEGSGFPAGADVLALSGTELFGCRGRSASLSS